MSMHTVKVTNGPVLVDFECLSCRSAVSCSIEEADDGARWLARHCGALDVSPPWPRLVQHEDSNWCEAVASHAEATAVADGFELEGGF